MTVVEGLSQIQNVGSKVLNRFEPFYFLIFLDLFYFLFIITTVVILSTVGTYGEKANNWVSISFWYRA